MRPTPLPLCLLLLLTAGGASAQGKGSAAPAAEVQASARAQGEEGLRLYNSGHWQEAFEQFQRADALFHAPTLTLFMAHAKKAQGLLVEARALYLRLAGEPVPAGAPEQFRKAQASARDEAEKLGRLIPTAQLAVSGAGADRAAVTVDGAPVPRAELGRKEVDPGSHTFTARSGDGPVTTRTVTFKEGAAVVVDLPLEGGPAGPAVATSPAGPVEPGAPPPDGARGSLVPAGVAFGVGALGLGIGIATGLASMGKVSDLKGRCDAEDHCPAADQAEASSAAGLATASTVGFLVGGAGVAAGVVLLLVRPRGGAPEAAATGVRVTFGPRSVQVLGAF